ncbi:hypothetical protein K466DRAFT_589859 [Polyporus arcularius HHB13444]|uniref:Uncharacterized protein n=1 Tax=Polyporus arcularius HHB13444 TaxID=1314778 RepID=A0A5C3PBR7_9APHY|nr:hypothetical protein K466DRAFT_589859 [Polyporus arcularius HHB13444]
MSSSEHHSNPSPALEGNGPAALSNDARPTTDSDAGFHPAPPSETVQPTEVTTPTQQAATQPGSGGPTVIVQQQAQPSFNQKVVGYAKEIRGTLLRKPETKDQGGKIRKGEEPWPPQDNEGTATSPTDANSTTD